LELLRILTQKWFKFGLPFVQYDFVNLRNGRFGILLQRQEMDEGLEVLLGVHEVLLVYLLQQLAFNIIFFIRGTAV
jgi:hypothetical protein